MEGFSVNMGIISSILIKYLGIHHQGSPTGRAVNRRPAARGPAYEPAGWGAGWAAGFFK